MMQHTVAAQICSSGSFCGRCQCAHSRWFGPLRAQPPPSACPMSSPWLWLLGLVLLVTFVALLRMIMPLCCPGMETGHWRCWSHEALRDEEDARVRHFPQAEPLKASLLARQDSLRVNVLPQKSPQPEERQHSRFAAPLIDLLKPVLPSRFSQSSEPSSGTAASTVGAGGGNGGVSHLAPPLLYGGVLTPISPSSSPDPEPPYSPLHTHPYAVATFQNPTWGSQGGAAILRPAQDLTTPQQGFRTLTRDIQREQQRALQHEQHADIYSQRRGETISGFS